MWNLNITGCPGFCLAIRDLCQVDVREPEGSDASFLPPPAHPEGTGDSLVPSPQPPPSLLHLPLKLLHALLSIPISLPRTPSSPKLTHLPLP